MEYIQIPAPDFSFESIAIEHAEKIKRSYLNNRFVSLYVNGGYSELLNNTIHEIHDLEGDNEKIVCISILLNHLSEYILKYKEAGPSDEALQRTINGVNRIKYSLYSIAKQSSGYTFDKDAFTDDEVSDLEKKIDTILDKLNTIQVGQEVLYDEINEVKADLESLKTDMPLGKKRWYQRATGIVISFAVSKGFDAIADETLKPLLKDLIHSYSPQVLESLKQLGM